MAAPGRSRSTFRRYSAASPKTSRCTGMSDAATTPPQRIASTPEKSKPSPKLGQTVALRVAVEQTQVACGHVLEHMQAAALEPGPERPMIGLWSQPASRRRRSSRSRERSGSQLLPGREQRRVVLARLDRGDHQEVGPGSALRAYRRSALPCRPGLAMLAFCRCAGSPARARAATRPGSSDATPCCGSSPRAPRPPGNRHRSRRVASDTQANQAPSRRCGAVPGSGTPGGSAVRDGVRHQQRDRVVVAHDQARVPRGHAPGIRRLGDHDVDRGCRGAGRAWPELAWQQRDEYAARPRHASDAKAGASRRTSKSACGSVRANSARQTKSLKCVGSKRPSDMRANSMPACSVAKVSHS